MKILIVYPHGLGDCILATPAIREYKESTDDFIGFATLERFRGAELFKHNPYVDEVHYTDDAWNNYPMFDIGMESVMEQCEVIKKEKKYDRIILIKHDPDKMKINECAKALGVTLRNPKTEVYISEADKYLASQVIDNIGMELPYGFVHSKTGVKEKDLPDKYGERWLNRKFGTQRFINPATMYDQFSMPIGAGFYIMQNASCVCLADSVYFHACCAMEKTVDFVYFAKGPSVYNRVRPLHDVKHNIHYDLETI